ncbi:hypothetical protein V6Z94_005294 [Aspergillus fumigatus]
MSLPQTKYACPGGHDDYEKHANSSSTAVLKLSSTLSSSLCWAAFSPADLPQPTSVLRLMPPPSRSKCIAKCRYSHIESVAACKGEAAKENVDSCLWPARRNPKVELSE